MIEERSEGNKPDPEKPISKEVASEIPWSELDYALKIELKSDESGFD